MVEAICPAAYGQYRRSLNAFCYSHAGEEIPPAFQVGDKFICCGKVCVYQTLFAAKLFFQSTLAVPGKNVFRSGFMPPLYEGTE